MGRARTGRPPGTRASRELWTVTSEPEHGGEARGQEQKDRWPSSDGDLRSYSQDRLGSDPSPCSGCAALGTFRALCGLTSSSTRRGEGVQNECPGA